MKRKKGEGSVFQRGAVYWVKYSRNGKAYRESSGSEKEIDARKLLRKRQGEIALDRFIGPEAERTTVRDLSEDFLNDYRVNQKKSMARAARSLTHILPYFGDYKAHHVRTDNVKNYVAHRQEQNAANATINRELSALKRMYNLGMQAEKIFRKPYIPMLEENNVRQGFFERAEFLALRAALPDYLKPVVTFAYFTGWRRGEIAGLKWHQVDLAAKSVRIKANQPRTTRRGQSPLTASCSKRSKANGKSARWPKFPANPLLCFASMSFTAMESRSGDFRDAWDKALKETGLAGKILHDFRRTAVRNMTRAGVHERVAMTVSGHKTRSVFDRYDIVSEDDQRDAARKVWEYAQEQEAAAKVVAIRSNQ